MTTTKTTGKGEVRVSWGSIAEHMDRMQAEHGVTDESIRATVEAHNARMAAGLPRRIVGGAEMYRDHGTREEYAVGYGGDRNYSRPAAPPRDYTPSDAQIKFLNDLLRDREHTYTEAQIAEGRADWRKIRPMIDELKVSARRDPRARKDEVVETSAPVATSGRIDFKVITDGNYAVPGEGDVIHFYRVSTKGNGFKKVQIRASDNLFDTRNFKQDVAILHQIVNFGLEASQMLFATKLERCWMCGRSLTNDVSRARGTGDECASK